MPYFTLCSILALALFVSAQSLPLEREDVHAVAAGSGRGVSAQWSPRKLNRKTQDRTGYPPNGDYGAGAASGHYGCRFYRDGPPAELFRELKELVLIEPHPMFVLSEMAEYLHQERACPLIYRDIMSRQAEEQIIKGVREHLQDYLNGNSPQSIDEDPCPTRYNITFFPSRYPRYVVEVVCSEPTDAKARSCTFCSTTTRPPTARSGFCRSHILTAMAFLTKDPNDPDCPSANGNLQTWRMCSHPDIGVGCRCLS